MSNEQQTSNSAVYEVQEGMDRDLNKEFRVTDTRTDSRVATCYVQSNADLVCAALNAYTADEPKATEEGVADARRWIAYLESEPQHEPDISIARVLRDLVQFYEWALPQITNRTADEPSSVAVNEPVFYRCETCKEIMLAAHLVGTDSHERIEETSEGQPYQVTCGPVRPSVLSAGEYINRFLPANWMNDSSLETWFPITAEELKRLKDERAAEPPSAWQPIETAPQDGRNIILANYAYVTEGYRRIDGVHVSHQGDKPLTPFSHWMPLPSPPVTKNSVETAPEGRGVRDNPPPHALGSSEGADTHSRLSEPDAANVAKPHDDPTAHRVADLRAQSQPTNEPTSVRASNEQLAQALRNLRDVAHREVSPRYSAALDKAFTLADIALGEFDSEGEVSREADVGPGGGVRATHATGSAPSKPGAAEPPSDDFAFPLDARVREVFGQTEGTIVAIDSRYEVECTDGKHRFYWHGQLERVAETKSEIPAAAQSAANSGQCESRKAAQSGTAAGASDETPAVDVAPIAKLTVRDGLVQRAGLYAPGLPDGDHDVFPVPLSPKGELRPHVLAEPPSAGIEEYKRGFCAAAQIMRQFGPERVLARADEFRASLTKDAGECGACDKPGEHCANVHGICSRHGGRAHETEACRQCHARPCICVEFQK